MKLRSASGALAAKRLPRGGKQLILFAALSVACPAALAQSVQLPVLPASDLARQNMQRVAASAAQIEAVLHKDAGLMVELKRWVAKDATDHGQLVSDSDLTEQSIYNRLETDVEFRSVATALLQKFGYLLPQLNPESPQAKEQNLLIQERAKWQAQDEEEHLTAVRQRPAANGLQQSQACDPGRDANCKTQPFYPATGRPEEFEGPSFQNGFPSVNPNAPAVPQHVPSILERAQLNQNEPGESSSDLALEDANDTAFPALTGLSLAGPGMLMPFSPGNMPQMQFQQSSASVLGLPAMANSSTMTGTGMEANLELQRQFTNLQANSSGTANSLNEMGSGLPTYEAGGASLSALYRNSSHIPSNSILSQAMLRQPNPYVDVPSLYDMYLQASPQPTTPDRFGMEVFENGTRNAQMIPFDLPVGPDYVVGPGDGLAINLWGGVSQQILRTVDNEGRVNLPEAGPVLVAGKSLAQVQESVQKTLRSQFRDVSADVSLSRLRTIRVYVVGDVEHPGAYDISSLSTPLNALFAAGGPTDQGSLRILQHNRGNQLVQGVDVYDLLLHGVTTGLDRLENGDTVLVPPIGPEITVEGMVRRPAIYELHSEKSLSDVLVLAGGLLPTATLRHVEVQRTIAHQKQTMLSLDIPADAGPESVTKQLDSFEVHDGDKIRIFPIAPYNEDTVYLEGHVLRPGKYSYHSGMRVTDLISSYKDLLPEPATQYAEIIRLDPPDYRPTVQSFNLSEALDHPGSAPLLEPLDTLQIFGRFDFENPPTVSVWGDVRVPGTYTTSGQIHVSDAIHMAGGLAPDAENEDAQVFRYMSDGQVKIFSVNLGHALSGDPTDNIPLDSRDRVLVHRNPADVNPATVYIKGEVARPGRYPLARNMTVADLIHAAGGLQSSADLNDADLTRYDWKEQTRVEGEHTEIALNSALKGDEHENVSLTNGDVLTIRQLPGWNDLGATIELRGEFTHPGSYGIRPGERLSAVLVRAGGLQPDAYPYGAVLIRSEVQQLEDKSHTELVERVRQQQASLQLASTRAQDPDEKLADQAAYQQWQDTVDSLMNNPPLGRVNIQVSGNPKEWANTPRDITVRAGDVLVVPKKPSFVLIQGQVYNPTAVAYRPGKSAKWYLSQAGGPTNLANKKAIFVVRANGTVIGGSHSASWFMGGALNDSLQPGDTVIVPEKALGGPPTWKALFQVVQIVSGITTSAVLAAHY